jgi:predicted HTH transcriptional regulator
MQPGFTKATLFAPRKWNEMDSKERTRACYQHACLCFVTGSRMTNSSLRNRFGIKPESSAQAPRLIREALKTQVIKLYDPDMRDRDRSYVPFQA